jgi:hypothetical protein
VKRQSYLTTNPATAGRMDTNTFTFKKPRMPQMTRMRFGVREHVRAFKAAIPRWRDRSPKRGSPAESTETNDQVLGASVSRPSRTFE